MQIEVGGGDRERQLREEMAKGNRRAAHQASAAQPEVRENRNVRPPWNRAIAFGAE